MEIVHSDIRAYLKKNIFPSRTVLVFPPFNGFRRFLIHKLIEDNFSSSEVAAFSIGQDISRRIVICYKGLLRDRQDKASIVTVPHKSGIMIEKEKQIRQKLTPSAAVYRPPAARLAESRRSADDPKSSDAKRKNVRRPDQQMYVPRPKRISFGNEQPRSRSRSSSMTSLDSDSCDKKKSSSNKIEESRLSGSSEVMGDAASDTVLKRQISETTCYKFSNVPSSSLNNASAKSSTTKDVPNAENASESGLCEVLPKSDPINFPLTASLISSDEIINKDLQNTKMAEEVLRLDRVEQPQHCATFYSECIRASAGKNLVDCTISDTNVAAESDKNTESENDIVESHVNSSNKDNRADKMSIQLEMKSPKPEVMETISISSDSRGDQSSNSFDNSSSNDSRNSDSSSDSETVLKPRAKTCEKMEVERSTTSEKKEDVSTDRRKSQEQNMKNRRIFPTLPVSDVLIITDASSSDDSLKTSAEHESSVEISEKKSKKSLNVLSKKEEKPVQKNSTVHPDECDWESLYDDSGECLVPDLMEELTDSVGRVKVTSVDSDYRPYQSIEERTSDGECVIEIYDFPSEFKTTDLFNIFAAYRNKNFQIKWVDDTHALGVFPSPLMADEVLASTLPFVKTRPLRLGIVESRNKARNLILPPLPSMERPKTCTALARRLVSGALGLRLPTSSQEREKEKQVLKEAREKRRLEAKQREAAWDGTLTSGSCI